MKKGFTLVELSIVLVIIGLLIGGILVGQSLIQSVKVNSILSEYGRHMNAFEMFRDKFRCLPGDCNLGFSQNGSGNNNIGGTGLSTTFTETHNIRENDILWLQLHEGGFLEIPYTGNNGLNGADRVIPGVNAPIIEAADDVSNEAILDYFQHFDPESNINTGWTRFEIGTETDNFGSARGRAFFPETALAIDLKIDDASPDTGLIRVDGGQSGCGRGTGSYDLDATNNCALFFYHKIGDYDFIR